MVEPELESRYMKMYPMHKCPQCQMEHTSIPHITTTIIHEDKVVESPLIPIELIGTGAIRMNSMTSEAVRPIPSPARILLLLWGPPGSQEPASKQFLFLN